MDENFNNEFSSLQHGNEDSEANVENENKNNENDGESNVNAFGIENIGNVRSDGGNRSIGEAAAAVNPRAYVILGWVSAALIILISPFFVIPGIIFGVMANRQIAGRGNAIIIVNATLAVVSMVLGLFMPLLLGHMRFGF